ncbi:MAG: DUF47 domain-containing protein [Acidobacteria bacterium]|nr:DUF47 domain-containing protein [Acidobacteriota bacterium]
MRILPREEKFFNFFLNHTKLIAQASRVLADALRQGDAALPAASVEIHSIEHQGDEIIHDVFQKLSTTFITPLDPEDIHEISTHLDDVLDAIEDVAYRMGAYGIRPNQVMVEMVQRIQACAVQLERAFDLMNKGKDALACFIEINKLEGEADGLVRGALATLFREETNAIELIKMKEIYELLESGVDACEDVADVLQNVVVKNS